MKMAHYLPMQAYWRRTCFPMYFMVFVVSFFEAGDACFPLVLKQWFDLILYYCSYSVLIFGKFLAIFSAKGIAVQRLFYCFRQVRHIVFPYSSHRVFRSILTVHRGLTFVRVI